jgi:energy-coupling factor transport system permease protein
MAAMRKMRMTEKITIPLSVMFRFFPTVREEYAAIGDAMRMRGVSLAGGKPMKMLEYRFVPMIMCSLKIGEELSAAALTRGLGSPIKRTNICKTGFHLQDIAFIALCVISLAVYIQWLAAK